MVQCHNTSCVHRSSKYVCVSEYREFLNANKYVLQFLKFKVTWNTSCRNEYMRAGVMYHMPFFWNVQQTSYKYYALALYVCTVDRVAFSFSEICPYFILQTKNKCQMADGEKRDLNLNFEYKKSRVAQVCELFYGNLTEKVWIFAISKLYSEKYIANMKWKWKESCRRVEYYLYSIGLSDGQILFYIPSSTSIITFLMAMFLTWHFRESWVNLAL